MSEALPGKAFNKPATAVGWFFALRRNFPNWYVASSRSQIHPKPWPQRFEPTTDPVYSYNELFIPGVTCNKVFALLVRARDWPKYYPNADAVEILSGSETLAADAKFRWKTFATTQQSVVELYEPDTALGWSAESPGTHAFHRWILAPQEGGTRVITEECQNGITAWLDQIWMNPSLHATHQLWLERLKSVATNHIQM